MKRKSESSLSTSVKKSRSRTRQSRQSRQIQAFLNAVEKKYLDTVISYASVLNAGYVISLNIIGEGDDYNQRNGRRIFAQYIEYDLFFTYGSAASSATPQYNAATWHLVYDRQPNGAAATYTDIFDTSTITLPAYSFKNIKGNQDRFRILKSWAGTVGYQGNTDTSQRVRGFLPLSNLPNRGAHITYGSGGVVLPTTGAVYLCYCTDNSTLNVISFYGGVRFVYTDA